jgi:23S rRNA pseudouridine1911/1915/1917 synthase
MLVAKTNEVHRRLQSAIQKKEVGRTYWAWVKGAPQQQSFTIRSYLGRHPRNRKRRAVVVEGSADARLAVTHCAVVATGSDYTKLECRLETGRTHQIRVHLAAVGLPILADTTYGVPYPGLNRQALHAVRIAFEHPISGEAVEVVSPVPQDLASVD